ncbi:MAG: hypothetical protein Q7R55_01380 [Candidatus Wildermuthbacteria bacterium]|nr:hypothetical protein [Candidatus Wildermuthbacteria bacterium]
MENEQQKKGYGYGKRPLWQWILLYVVVGAVVYGAIYYFVFAKKGGYDSNQNPSPYQRTY